RKSTTKLFTPICARYQSTESTGAVGTVKDVWTARTFSTQRRRVHRDAESCKSLLAPNINAPVSKATEQATFAKMCFLLHCFRHDEPALSKRTFTVSNLNIESMPHLRLGGVQGALAGARFVTTLSKPLDRHRQVALYSWSATFGSPRINVSNRPPN